jgi:hypothetical protein
VRVSSVSAPEQRRPSGPGSGRAALRLYPGGVRISLPGAGRRAGGASRGRGLGVRRPPAAPFTAQHRPARHASRPRQPLHERRVPPAMVPPARWRAHGEQWITRTSCSSRARIPTRSGARSSSCGPISDPTEKEAASADHRAGSPLAGENGTSVLTCHLTAESPGTRHRFGARKSSTTRWSLG